MTFEMQLANPIKIETGQKINKPGIYLMDAEWYHDDCCAGPSVSSTGVKQFLHCPAKFWQQSYMNPDRKPEIKPKEKSYFDFGKAAHTLFLGDEKFAEKFVVREYENEDWKDWRKQAAKDWREEMSKKGFGVLTADDMERLKRLAEVCRKSYEIKEMGILDGYVERSLVFQDHLTGIWIKTRPDVIPPYERTDVDLKTTGQDADEASLNRILGNLGQYIQAGMKRWAYRKLLQQDFDKFFLMTVENCDFPAYSLNPIELDDVARGEELAHMAIEQMGKCFETGIWETYEGNMKTVQLTPYQRDRIDNRLAAYQQSKFQEAAE